jgi:hypothetical protein
MTKYNYVLMCIKTIWLASQCQILAAINKKSPQKCGPFYLPIFVFITRYVFFFPLE